MRQAVPAFIAALLLAGPSLAETPVKDPATKVAIEMLDHCLATMSTQGDYDKDAQRKGWKRTATGGWGKKVGQSMMATELAKTNLASGSFRICAINMSPATVDLPGLKAALAERAARYPLTPVAPRLDKKGGTQSGYENPAGPLIGLTITEQPAAGDLPARTYMSVIWKI